MEYEIMISKSDWDQIFENSQLDKYDVSITSSYVSFFEKEITKFEELKIKLYYRIGRISETRERSSTPYFTGNCFCSTCRVNYKFRISNEPNSSYVKVEVELDEVHDRSLHEIRSSKKLQIRGAERVATAKEIILAQGGSSKDYRFSKISEAAHNDNNGKNYEKYSQNVASEEVLRKIKSEYRKGNTGSNLIELDWLGRLYEIGDVLRMTVKGKCIDG